MNSLIPIAKRVAANYYIPGVDYDDKVQECLIAAWLHPQPTKGRARTVMVRRLYALAKKEKKVFPESFDETIHSSTHQVFFVVKGEVKKIFWAMALSNGHVEDAAKVLGMTKFNLYYRLRKIRNSLTPSEVVL